LPCGRDDVGHPALYPSGRRIAAFKSAILPICISGVLPLTLWGHRVAAFKSAILPICISGVLPSTLWGHRVAAFKSAILPICQNPRGTFAPNRNESVPL